MGVSTSILRKCRGAIFGCLVLGAGVPARAHDPGLSFAEIRLEKEGLTALLTFSQDDIGQLISLDADRDGRLTAEEFAEALPQLRKLASLLLQIESNAQPVATIADNVRFDESNAIYFTLTCPRTIGPRLNLRSSLLASLPSGHRQFLSLRDAHGAVLVERILDAKNNACAVDLNAVWSTRFLPAWQFVALGVEHIWLGYDHLLFLFGLLVVGGSFLQAVKIVTSFTVAHSITLAVATLQWVSVPLGVVEALIAASISYVGVENIFRRNLQGRWLLTFGFGLIHGFGFATALRDLGIGSSAGGILVPLFSFNLGVEIGQCVAVALLLPVVWSLNTKPLFARTYRPALSLLVTFTGLYWFVQRAF